MPQKTEFLRQNSALLHSIQKDSSGQNIQQHPTFHISIALNLLILVNDHSYGGLHVSRQISVVVAR